MAEKRIIATIKPQYEEQGGKHIFTHDQQHWKTVDVTETVLAMPLASIQTLKDDTESTDALIEGRYAANGPYRVEVETSLYTFFNVFLLSEITPSMLDKAKEHRTDPATKRHQGCEKTQGAPNWPTLSHIILQGETARDKAIALAVKGSLFFALEPYPENHYRLSVKPENEAVFQQFHSLD